jgi:hypothetical protein
MRCGAAAVCFETMNNLSIKIANSIAACQSKTLTSYFPLPCFAIDAVAGGTSCRAMMGYEEICVASLTCFHIGGRQVGKMGNLKMSLDIYFTDGYKYSSCPSIDGWKLQGISKTLLK